MPILVILLFIGYYFPHVIVIFQCFVAKRKERHEVRFILLERGRFAISYFSRAKHTLERRRIDIRKGTSIYTRFVERCCNINSNWKKFAFRMQQQRLTSIDTWSKCQSKKGAFSCKRNRWTTSANFCFQKLCSTRPTTLCCSKDWIFHST